MKFLKSEILAGILLLCGTWAEAYEPAAYLLGEVQAQTPVNVRKTASPAAPVIGLVKPHEMFLVIKQEKWFLILDGRYAGGFIYEDFVLTTRQTYPVGKLFLDQVRLHSMPDANGKVVALGKSDESFAILKSGEWYQIKDGPYKNAFVAASALKVLDQAPILEKINGPRPVYPESSSPTLGMVTATSVSGTETAATVSSASGGEAGVTAATVSAPSPSSMTAAAPAEASKVAATPPNWDAKKEERFQNQVDKIFASKKKKQGNQGETVINIPVYFEGKSKPIGQVDARVKENEATQIDGVAFFKYLRDLIAPSWFEKPEIKAVTPSDQEIKDAGTGANRKWIGVEPFQNSGVNITYNDKLLELRIDVPPAFRSTELATLDTRGGENIDQAEKPANFSSFLNVNGSDVMDTRDMTYHDHRSPLHAQLENGTNLYGYVLEANGTFAEQRSEVDTTEKQFTRQDVRIVKDFPDWGIRTRVGDLLYPVDRYQVFRTMAGVAVTSQFGMKNSKLTYPSGNYELFLQRPSKVYVWINDQLMQVLNLEAGRHQIKDFPFASGMNEIRLEIVDDLGRTETQTYSYFSSSDLLAPGLHQFNYAVGAPSTTNFGERSYDSSKPIVSLFHHYGWNETLTLGANVQSTDGQAVYGVDALMSTTVGYFKLETARSTNDIYGDGFASGIRYLFSDHGGVEKSQRTFNLGVSQQSEQFTSLAQGSNPTNNYLLYEVTAGYTTGLSRSLSGNIGVKYDINKQPTPDIGDSFSLSVGVNKRWDDGPTTSLTLSHTRSEKGDEQISALLFLVWSFPKDNQVITATNNTAAHTTRADWSYNPSSGANSANYSVDVSDGQTEQGYGGQINYNGNRSRISLADEVILTKQNANTSTATDQSQSKKSNNLATLQFGTALVFAGGHFAVSRPVTDSFAVIAPVKNLKGQRLDLNPDSEGRYIASSTPWLGAAVAPELSSYNFSTLTIGSKHVPAEMSVPRDHYDLYPGYKSGYIFELGTDATVYLVASLKNSKGQPLSNSSGRAIYLDKAGEEPVVVFTNRKGSLRSEGFKPGRYRLEMAGEQQLEATELTIPESANGEYEAGTLQLKGQ